MIKEAKCIPYIEISAMCREIENGLLFINCNPSGTDYEHYEDKNKDKIEECFYYDNPQNDYFKESRKFANQVGIGDNFAMIDFFPIVIQKQADLKKKVEEVFSGKDKTKKNHLQNEVSARIDGERKAFKELIDIFLDAIKKLNPQVIVVTNAFVRDLFVKKLVELEYITELEAEEENQNQLVYHKMKITKTNYTFTLFCGGMIAGGHRMDRESQKRLERDVRLFLER